VELGGRYSPAICVKSSHFSQQAPPPTSISAEKSRPDSEEQAPTALDDEMRAKRAIKMAEKDHEANLERAPA